MDIEERDDKQIDIELAYLKIVEEINTRPTYSDFIDHDITRAMIRTRWGGIEKLHQHMDANFKDRLDGAFTSLDTVFSSAPTSLSKRRYIITTAVADSNPHMGFMDALTTYSKTNDAQIVIMPCESVTNSFARKTAVFHSIFNRPEYSFVSEDTDLNANIRLCSIQVSANQIRPITGLSRIGNREGSFIFASTKQFLEYVPSGNQRGKNFSIMTTGACTLPSYKTDVYASKRISYIADHDHLIGAVIVEIENDQIFHFRQIQAADDGSFIDFGRQYNPDGTVEDVTCSVVLGDLHSSNVDVDALDATLECFSKLKIVDVFLHDVFDGYSINHHVTTIKERAVRHHEKASNLSIELELTYDVISAIDKALSPQNVIIVKSNHDEFLSRYLEQGRYVDDPENHYYSLIIARALFEGGDILAKGFEVVGKEIPSSWKFLTRQASFKIAGVECGSHGDLGLNGAKPSLATLERVYGNCVIGHNHTAAIHRGVFRVGTLSKLDLGYNKGPTSWTHTSCIIYANGQRQLINVIGGKCSIEGETV